VKNQLSRLLIALALCASLQQAAAQGTAFTYQGQLDNGTNPSNGSSMYAGTGDNLVHAAAGWNIGSGGAARKLNCLA